MKNTGRKGLALLLALVIVLTLMPRMALPISAENGQNPSEENHSFVAGNTEGNANAAENGSLEVSTADELVNAVAQSHEEVITLTNDIELNGTSLTIAAGVSVKINLNGHTLSSIRDSGCAVINKGTLKLMGGSVTGTAYGICNNGGSLNMNSVTVTSKDVAFWNNGASANSVLENCMIKVTAPSDGSPYGVYMLGGFLKMVECTAEGSYIVIDIEGGTTEITNSTVTGIDGCIGAVYTSQDTTSEVTITGSTITCENNAAINQWGYGKITVDNSTCKTENGSCAIEHNRGTMELKNGTALYNGADLGTIGGGAGTKDVTMDSTVIAHPSVKLTSYWGDIVTSQPEGYTKDETAKTVTISSPEGLAWWAKHASDHDGYTIKIVQDLDMGAYLWPDIRTDSGTFTIDGQKADGSASTIKNLIVADIEGSAGAGFLSDVADGLTMKNLIFDGAIAGKAGASSYVGVILGYTHEDSSRPITLENVHVVNSKVQGLQQLGGFIGKEEGCTVILKNCSVQSTEINGYAWCGGFVGLCQNQVTVDDQCVANAIWVPSRPKSSYYCFSGFCTKDYTSEVDLAQPVKTEGVYYLGGYTQTNAGVKIPVLYAAWGDQYIDYNSREYLAEETPLGLAGIIGLCHSFSPHTGFTDWEVIQQPTETEPGEEKGYCNIGVCCETKTRYYWNVTFDYADVDNPPQEPVVKQAYFDTYTPGGTNAGTIEEMPAEPTRTGYTFAGWKDSATGRVYPTAELPPVTDHVTYTAQWAPAADTAYVVEHYQQSLAGTGYELRETERLTGTTGSTVLAAPKTYEGFTYDNRVSGTVLSGTVLPDGTLVLKLYYTRNKYTVTFVDEDGTTVLKAAAEYAYGTAAADIVKPADPTKAATAQYTYTFAGWTPTIEEVTKNVTYRATYAANLNSYTLTYDAVGGEGAPVDEKAYHISDIAELSTRKPTHADVDGKKVVFIGWSAKKDDTIYTKDAAAPEVITKVTFVTTDITVYAVWGYDEDNDNVPDVTERKITITGEKAESVYSGELQTSAGYIAEGLAEGDRIVGLTYAAEGTDANTAAYEGVFDGESLKIVDKDGRDVTANYFVTYVPGTLTIHPAALEVRTPSGSKTYDGNALDGSALTEKAEIIGFVKNETATITVTGAQTLVGNSENTYVLTWNGSAKETNYTVSETLGTLTVSDVPGAGEDPIDDLVVRKTHAVPAGGTFQPGDVVTFTVTATNIYNEVKTMTFSEIAGVSLAKSVFTNVAPGATVSTTATYTITEADIQAGTFVNQVTVSFHNGARFTGRDTVDELADPTPVESGYPLTVKYVYKDGTEAAPTVTLRWRQGEEYWIDSPVIEGYTANAAFVAGIMGGHEITWTIVYTPNNAPQAPIVVDVPGETLTVDPNPGGGIEFDSENQTLIPVDEEGTPLGNLDLDGDDGHKDCALHFILILAAMLVMIFYTGSMKKHQKKIQKLTEELELEKKHRSSGDDSGENE